MGKHRIPSKKYVVLALGILVFVVALVAEPQLGKFNSPDSVVLEQASDFALERPGYLQTADGLVSLTCITCQPEELQHYSDIAHQLAVVHGEPFEGAVVESFEIVGDKAVKQDQKKLLRRTESDDGLVTVEMDCDDSCDVTIMNHLQQKFAASYKRVVNLFSPSEVSTFYFGVSPDGERFNIGFYSGEEPTALPRRGTELNSYPWKVNAPFDQTAYEIGVYMNFDKRYTNEGFLGEFWGHLALNAYAPGMDQGYYSHRDKFVYSFDDENSFEQGKLGYDVYFALISDGFGLDDFAQLSNALDGTESKWNEFKETAKRVSGKKLAMLDTADEGVELYLAHAKSVATNTN